METARKRGVVPQLAAVVVVAVVVVAVILVIGAAVLVVYLPPKNGSRASSPSSSAPSAGSTHWTTFNSTVSSSGLQVQAWLNATTVPVGRALSAEVRMFNTLPSNVSLTPDFSADAGLIALTANNSCMGAGLDAMLNFALYQGRYSANNFSRAPSPLMLDPPVGMGCPNMLGVTSYIHLVVFAPKSDNATMSPAPSAAGKATSQTDEMQLSPATGSCSASPYRFNGTTVENQSTTTSSGTAIGYGCYVFGTGTAGLNGYWTAPVNGSDVQIDTRTNSSEYASFVAIGTYFHQFSPGAYTLVAEDLWNQTVFAHFEIVPPEPVEVLSVTGPIPPYDPGGPMVRVDVKNTGDAPIASLNASLGFVPPENLPAQATPPYQYSFSLGVNASHPLLQGHDAQETRRLVGAGFATGTMYPLRISGTFANGTEFSYVLDVQVSTP